MKLYSYFQIAKISAILIIFLLIFLTCILIVRAIRAEQKRHQYALDWEQRKMQSEHFQQYRVNYIHLQEQRHDMKHHISYMRELIARKEYQKLDQYIYSLINELQS